MRQYRLKDQIQSQLNTIAPDKPWLREDAKEFIGFGSAKDAELLQPDFTRFDKEVISINNRLYLITSYLNWWRITHL